MKIAPYLTNERTLLSLTAQGDQNAFAALYRFYHPLLSTHIFRITRVQAITDEIVQDVFLKIWTNRSALVDISNFRTYIGIISRNAALNELRNLQRKEARHRVWEREHESAVVYDSVSFAKEDMTAQLDIDSAIELLPQRQRHVYLLFRQQHLKYAQIAQEMHLTRGTVKRYLQLARATIAKHLRSQISGCIIFLIVFLDF